jgi:hypothetical protein
MLSYLIHLLRASLRDQVQNLRICSEKLSYIEYRLDQATCTLRDSLRHLTQKISEFLPEVGSSRVLVRWCLSVRDAFLLRRSEQEWLVLSATAQIQLMSECIWERIQSNSVGPLSEDHLRILKSLKTLSSMLRSSQWCPLSNIERITEGMPEHASVVELYNEIREHRLYLADLAVSEKKEWAQLCQGFSVSAISALEGHK